jgi:hypothetical protein
MSRFRTLLGFMTWLALLTLLLDAGCSRPTGLNGAEGSTATDPRQVPFREADAKGPANSNATTVASVSDKSTKADTGLPFRDADNLPAGTLLTVRLKDPVSADNPEASGRFEGVIDEPVMVDGNLLVPSGTSVAGRVESARSSKVQGSGFVRVTLDSIDIAGKDLHLQTSSLFARGSGASHSPAIQAITLEKGRRLTFRLTEPAYVAQLPSSSR